MVDYSIGIPVKWSTRIDKFFFVSAAAGEGPAKSINNKLNKLICGTNISVQYSLKLSIFWQELRYLA